MSIRTCGNCKYSTDSKKYAGKVKCWNPPYRKKTAAVTMDNLNTACRSWEGRD